MFFRLLYIRLLNKRGVVFLLILGSVFLLTLYLKNLSAPPPPTIQTNQSTKNSEAATLISTNPSPLEGIIILPNQVIEVTLSDPLENEGELKHKISPQMEFEIKLSSDKKVAKFIPKRPYNMGTGYTLTIQTEQTKFITKKKLDKDYEFHFQTIKYQGI